MASISKPNTFSASTTALSSEVNANFDTIYNDYNGNINSDNLATDAVTTAKIADGAVTTAKLGANAVTPAKLDADLAGGWQTLSGTHSVATTYNAGNRSFTIDTTADHSSLLSEGMRYRVTRNTAPPTQCADLEASSSHYASKASPSGTTISTTMSVEAWIKLESYPSSGTVTIISEYNGTNGWIFDITTEGRVRSYMKGTGTDNKYTDRAIPLNKWVHVAATRNIGTANAFYIDGVSTDFSSASTGTSVTQAGALEVGAYNSGTNLFDGKLADVRVWSDVRTATEIQDNMYAYPSDTTGLIAHFKLNGDFTDASSNGNDLTAQNSAVATNADNPWNSTEYGIITAVSASTIQVFCPEGYGIPNETLTSPYYSTQSAPYGFPRDKGLWKITAEGFISNIAQATPTASQWYNIINFGLSAPIGAWKIGYTVSAEVTDTTSAQADVKTTLTTTDTTETNFKYTDYSYQGSASGTQIAWHEHTKENYEDLSAQTTYYLNIATEVSGVNNIHIRGTYSPYIIYAECAYL